MSSPIMSQLRDRHRITLVPVSTTSNLIPQNKMPTFTPDDLLSVN